MSLELKGYRSSCPNFLENFQNEVAKLSLSEKRGLGWEGSVLQGLGETKFLLKERDISEGPGLESFDGT